MAREDLHFRLRIPEDLKKRVEAIAEVNGRSMTAEIVSRLETSMNDERQVRVDTAVIEQLRIDLAYQQGMNASLRANMDIFLKHLASPENDATVVLKRIIEDINKLSAPPRKAP